MLEQRRCLCHRPSRRRHERHRRPAAAQPPSEPPPELPLAAVRPAAAAHQPPLSRRPSRRLSCRWPPSDPRRPTRRMPRPPRSGARACHRHDVHWCTAAGPVVHDPRAFSPHMLRAHDADDAQLHDATRMAARRNAAAAHRGSRVRSPSLPLARLRARCLLPSPLLSQPATVRADDHRADPASRRHTAADSRAAVRAVDTTAEPTPPPERHRCSSNVAARATARAAAATQV